MLLMPPTADITTSSRDGTNPKVSGTTAAWKWAYRLPATEARAALRAKILAFRRATSTPTLSAASSLPCRARRALPTGECTTFRPRAMAASAASHTTK